MERSDWRRAALRRAIVPAVLAVAGIACALAGERYDAVWITGWVLLGLAGILAVALLFLEVGFSEDRERARSSGGPPGPRG